MILFGGWTNNWLGDTYSLKVSMITGPPYAIYNITPNMGPLTGKTKVRIDGDGFKDSNNIIVRFDSHSKATSPEVQGVYISETQIECETPSFADIGVKSSVVTISINKGDYTITSSKFTFYYNTKADECIAYGPGLLTENCPDHETIFCIQARNSKG